MSHQHLSLSIMIIIESLSLDRYSSTKIELRVRGERKEGRKEGCNHFRGVIDRGNGCCIIQWVGEQISANNDFGVARYNRRVTLDNGIPFPLLIPRLVTALGRYFVLVHYFYRVIRLVMHLSWVDFESSTFLPRSSTLSAYLSSVSKIEQTP